MGTCGRVEWHISVGWNGTRQVFLELVPPSKRSTIGLITVFEATLMSGQTRLEITVFVWKSDVK